MNFVNSRKQQKLCLLLLFYLRTQAWTLPDLSFLPMCHQVAQTSSWRKPSRSEVGEHLLCGLMQEGGFAVGWQILAKLASIWISCLPLEGSCKVFQLQSCRRWSKVWSNTSMCRDKVGEVGMPEEPSEWAWKQKAFCLLYQLQPHSCIHQHITFIQNPGLHNPSVA